MLQFLVLQDGLVVELKQEAQHQPLQFSLVNYTGKHRTLYFNRFEITGHIPTCEG